MHASNGSVAEGNDNMAIDGEGNNEANNVVRNENNEGSDNIEVDGEGNNEANNVVRNENNEGSDNMEVDSEGNNEANNVVRDEDSEGSDNMGVDGAEGNNEANNVVRDEDSEGSDNMGVDGAEGNNEANNVVRDEDSEGSDNMGVDGAEGNNEANNVVRDEDSEGSDNMGVDGAEGNTQANDGAQNGDANASVSGQKAPGKGGPGGRIKQKANVRTPKIGTSKPKETDETVVQGNNVVFEIDGVAPLPNGQKYEVKPFNEFYETLLGRFLDAKTDFETMGPAPTRTEEDGAVALTTCTYRIAQKIAIHADKTPVTMCDDVKHHMLNQEKLKELLSIGKRRGADMVYPLLGACALLNTLQKIHGFKPQKCPKVIGFQVFVPTEAAIQKLDKTRREKVESYAKFFESVINDLKVGPLEEFEKIVMKNQTNKRT